MTGNVLNALPKSLQAKAKAALYGIWMAPTRERKRRKESGPATGRKPQSELDPKIWGQALRNSDSRWKPYVIWISVLGLIWYLCNLYLDSNGFTLKRMVKEVSSHGPWI